MNNRLHNAPARILSVFIVENHPDTLKYLRMYIEQLGHRVQTANSMSEALEKLPTADCEVLISDIGLPDGDGWELMRRTRFNRPVYAIAMSGFGMNADRETSKAAGFRHHMLKPLSAEKLDEVLEEAARELPQE